MTDNEEVSVPKIVKATMFRFLFGQRELVVELEGGGVETLFSWFVDELYFTEEEFVGLTVAEAYEVHRKRDVAFLQS